jgi:heme oxygenase (biliverdin-IX-beta and delta-forming)
MVLQRLRDETRPLHDEVERDLEQSGAYTSMEQYQVLLARFFGFFKEWEPQVGEILADETFFGPRRKLHLLQKDLHFFGYGPATIAALPRCPDLPPVRDLAGAMGSLYVLEGSTLGGQVISHRLERLFGLRDGHGYAFFRSYGREVSSMWRSFGERLASVSSPGTEEASIRSANLTFARLHGWLCHGA